MPNEAYFGKGLFTGGDEFSVERNYRVDTPALGGLAPLRGGLTLCGLVRTEEEFDMLITGDSVSSGFGASAGGWSARATLYVTGMKRSSPDNKILGMRRSAPSVGSWSAEQLEAMKRSALDYRPSWMAPEDAPALPIVTAGGTTMHPGGTRAA